MTDADYLAAIIASPDDDALRSAWAEALLAHGDLRGELITNQLASTRTRAHLVRERELVAKHGKKWAGSLARWFSTHVFHRGLFAGGSVTYRTTPDALFDDPACALVTWIDVGGSSEHLDTFLDHPRSRIRNLHGLREADVCELLEKRQRRSLVELGMRGQVEGPTTDHPLRTCDSLPDLRVLSLNDVSQRLTDVLADAPVIERLELLRITEMSPEYSALPQLVAALARRPGKLRTIEVQLHARREDLGWVVRIERDVAPGPFVRLIAWQLTDRAPKDLAEDCGTILHLAPPSDIRTLEIDIGRTVRMPPASVRKRVAQLEAMTSLAHVRVPWAFEAPAGNQTRWEGWLRGTSTLDTSVVFDRFVVDGGVPLDRYSVNDRGMPKLGRDPRATLAERAASSTTQTLALRREGSADHVTIRRVGDKDWARYSFASSRDSAWLTGWFLRALVLVPHGTASLYLATTKYSWNGFPLEGHAAGDPGWLVAVPLALPAAARADLVRRAPFIRLLDSTSHLALAIGATATEATPERVRAAADALVATLDAVAIPEAPPWFAPLAIRHLDAQATRLRGAVHAESPVRVEWRSSRDSYVRARLIRASNGAWDLHANIAGEYNETLASERIVDEASAAEALRRAAKLLEDLR